MFSLIAKLAPLITGMTKHEDGTPRAVAPEFNRYVRLPLALGAILLLVGLFGPVPEDKRDELYQVGLALLVGGPATYSARKRMKKGDVAKAPVEVTAPPVPVEAPKTDEEAARKIENL
jgi:hypothetical protein